MTRIMNTKRLLKRDLNPFDMEQGFEYTVSCSYEPNDDERIHFNKARLMAVARAMQLKHPHKLLCPSTVHFQGARSHTVNNVVRQTYVFWVMA